MEEYENESQAVAESILSGEISCGVDDKAPGSLASALVRLDELQ